MKEIAGEECFLNKNYMGRLPSAISPRGRTAISLRPIVRGLSGAGAFAFTNGEIRAFKRYQNSLA
jgi:hypothetical protein